MNDELDNFEQCLHRQPVKPLPVEWRAEILAAAQAAQPSPPASPMAPPGWPRALHRQLVSLLWPHPQAWAGLTAVWGGIILLHCSLREPPPVFAAQPPSPALSPAVVAELQQQHKLYAELMGTTENRVADRQRITAPQPRSQHEDGSAA